MAAMEKIKQVQEDLQPARVRLELSERSVQILTEQAAQRRNVTNISASEKKDLKTEAVDRFKARWYAPSNSSGKSGGSVGGGNLGTDWREVWRAAGEWMRQLIADKIEDKKPVSKKPLSQTYSRQKKRIWGKIHPILVASGDLLADVREAVVRVEKI